MNPNPSAEASFQMNTNSIGNALEDEVFSLIPIWLETLTLPYPKDDCRIHRRKPCFSKIRESDINFENVVEIYSAVNLRSENPQPALVAIMECKNTKRPVTIEEIEEFKSKLDGVLGFRTKGYLVTRVGFTASSVRMSRNLGIGLIRIIPENQLDFVMHYMTLDAMKTRARGLASRTLRALTHPSYISDQQTEFCSDDGCAFEAVGAMLSYAINSRVARSARLTSPKRIG